MKKLLFALAIVFAASCKKEDPVPAITNHTILLKFHSDDPALVLRNYTYPVNGSLVSKQDTVYQQNTTVAYQWDNRPTTEHYVSVHDIHLPITNDMVSCEIWIDGVMKVSEGPQISNATCEWYIQ